MVDGKIKRAIFIDGSNFKYATYKALKLKVDFNKLLEVLSKDRYLLRAYYYSGIWTEESIKAFIRLKENSGDEDLNNSTTENSLNTKERDIYANLISKRKKELDFLRFLSRSGYHVVTKPVRVYKDYLTEEAMFKANLDIEIVLDMLRIASHVDEIVLVSGDGDFVPVIKELQNYGVRIIVVTTLSREAQTNGYKASEELIDVSDEFIEIEDLVNLIRR
ncbi:MAG: NYN domain-containing protein [Actinobacteria bacterium]|nr:NYN domain-containing protein [Actinomycetota bacterium]